MTETTAATRERDSLLDQAERSGMIRATDRALWAGAYDRDPVGTRRELTTASLGAPAPKSSPVAASSAASSGSAAPAEVGTDPDTGAVTYAGEFPVEMANGEPCVFTPQGWMSVAAFRASALTIDDLRSARATVAAAPTGPTARAFAAGPAGA